jgi:hypothetical protein
LYRYPESEESRESHPIWLTFAVWLENAPPASIVFDTPFSYSVQSAGVVLLAPAVPTITKCTHDPEALANDIAPAHRRLDATPSRENDSVAYDAIVERNTKNACEPV